MHNSASNLRPLSVQTQQQSESSSTSSSQSTDNSTSVSPADQSSTSIDESTDASYVESCDTSTSEIIEDYKLNDYFNTVNGRHVCKTCNKDYSVSTSSKTKKAHAYKHVNDSSAKFYRLSAEDKLQLIVRLIVTCCLPFTIVESPVFRQITGTRFKRHTISAKIKEEYQKKKFALRQQLATTNHVAITTDLWTSAAQRPYACYTAHYHSNGKLTSTLLDFIGFPHPHNASQLSKHLDETFDYYDIRDKIFTITADGAANNKASINLNNAMRNLHNLPNLVYVNCVCHIINLVVEYATELSQLDSSINKARELCKAIKYSTRIKQRLEESCKSLNIPYKAICLDVKTRWNSLYFMLRRLIELREPVNNIIQGEISLEEHMLLDFDWRIIEQACVYLRRFSEVTNEMSKANTFNYSSVVPLYRSLISKCESSLGNPITDRALEKLKKYEDKVITQSALEATFLDPYLLHILPQAEIDTIAVRLRGMLPTAPEAPAEPQGQSIRADPEWFQPSNEDEVTRYLKVLRPQPDDDICTWWEAHSKSFPHLHEMAKKYMIVRPSSVASESTFSEASWLIAPKRTRLSDETIAACMFLHSYYLNQINVSGISEEEDDE